MTYAAIGGEGADLSDGELSAALSDALSRVGKARRVLILPPDGTRAHAKAGPLLSAACGKLGSAVTDILPALGTHRPMAEEEIAAAYPGVDPGLFRVHDWRAGFAELGRIPADYVAGLSGGRLSWDWPAQVSSLVASGGHDLLVSIGQVLPHEVVGMANHSKNLFIGTGGAEAIHKSHFLGAVCGMERVMGRPDSPPRLLLNRALEEFGNRLPPILWVLTVVSPDASGHPRTRGLFIGDDLDCYRRACTLSLRVNLSLLEKPLRKAVAWLDPREFRSLWLGNKAIYRLRMAMADGAELLVLGPGVDRFGEDPRIDSLIRRHGYRGTEATLAALAADPELGDSLATAAHLIHGSTEGRFRVTWAAGGLSRAEVEAAGYAWAPCREAALRYGPGALHDGLNVVEGEEVFFVSNPALGLWSSRERFGRA